jgi:virginiamycin A acetyltransferase
MGQGKPNREGKSSRFCSAVLLPLYGATKSKAFRSLLRRMVLRMEGGEVYSLTIREMLRRFHDITVGLYTIGPCAVEPGNLAKGTRIGRYSSIYYTVRTLSHDGPLDHESSHGLFCDSVLDGGAHVPKIELEIGNDAFIGHNAIILPSVERVGDGAFIGAGSVVRSTVPPYAVVTGNPARVVRYRFSENKIQELLEEKWWLKSIDELSHDMDSFQKPIEVEGPVR